MGNGFVGPIRSYLFAPGSRPEVLGKLPRSHPDGAVIDLEDAVPVAQKDEARANAAVAVPRLLQESPDLAVFIRVNSVRTPWFFNDVAALPGSLTGVVVPKLESLDDVSIITSTLADAGLHVPVVAGIETAFGVENVREILRSPVAAVYFGAEDFATDIAWFAYGPGARGVVRPIASSSRGSTVRRSGDRPSGAPSSG